MVKIDTSEPSIVVAYVPVVHRGYLEFFARYPTAKKFYVIGEELLKRENYIRKDLRAFTSEQALSVVKKLNMFKDVYILTESNIEELFGATVVFPDDDISHRIAEEFNIDALYVPIFLRWDRRNVSETDLLDTTSEITESEFEKNIMNQALKVANISTDIWRRVGAVLLDSRNKFISESANNAVPDPVSSIIEGDPRNIFNKGVGIEISTFMHAEAGAIATAARKGIALENATIYVTTYPCPTCAKLIAKSGIKRCYFKDGYAVLDGKRTLDDAGVVVTRVLVEDLPDRTGEWAPYKKSKP